MFKPWELAAIDTAGYNGIRDEHIDLVAGGLLSTGKTEIDRSAFNDVCYSLGINPENFDQDDLGRLQNNLKK